MLGNACCSTLRSSPLAFSTLRRYTVWTMSRVSGSIMIGPRGLVNDMPLKISIALSASILPLPSFCTTR